MITEQGRYLPFEVGFTVREVVTASATGGQFLVLARDDRHGCAARRAAHRTQEGRMLTTDRTKEKSWRV